VSRKNLSRTVIEGGRYYGNSWLRRASHGRERATTRGWLDRVAQDLEEANATLAPARRQVHKHFRDKLAPAQRWLVSQVDRPWSKVYSELCARFDMRTVAGRHVVHDHMLKWVRHHDDSTGSYGRRYELVIDAQGILRKPRWLGRSYAKLRADVEAWAGGRACALTYRGWWWFRHEGVGEPCVAHPWKCSDVRHRVVGDARYHAAILVGDRPMSRRQVRYLARIPEQLRARFVIPSPWPAR
jgi:hypothetical protein